MEAGKAYFRIQGPTVIIEYAPQKLGGDVTVLTIASIIGCGLLLWSQSKVKIVVPKGGKAETTGHSWDEGLEELNNPMPRWWLILFWITAIFGAAIGFLWYNSYPAQVFMGDTGSLALGGMLGSMAVAIKHEIVLGIIGGLFVVEALSVMIQVVSFKLTGKRVFRMAPIHHHFELKGWPEPRVIVRFWIISVVLALGGLTTLKLR